MIASAAAFPAQPRLRPHRGRSPSRRYERRRPEKTPLHTIVSENLASWLAWREAAERPVPGHVEEELRGYLGCGILCFGFGRAFCTGLGTGSIGALTKILLDEIKRSLITASGVSAAVATPSAPRPRLGGISFLHRFGSTLNHHVHLHACVTDGVFVPAADGVTRDASGRITRVRYVLPRHKAANWVGPGRS